MKSPGVGVGVFIVHDRKVLMSYRKDNGLLALPGGHLERFESLQECAEREVLEEVGIQIDNYEYFMVQNVIRKDIDHHYVVIFMKGLYNGQQIKNNEPHKHDDWMWVDEIVFEQHYHKKMLFHGLMLICDQMSVGQLFDKL